MKKFLTMAVVAMAMSASATSVFWGANTSNSKIFGLTSGTTMSVTGETASMTIYYLLYSDYDAILALGKVAASELKDTNGDSYVMATAKGQTSTSSGAAGRFQKSSTVTAFETSGVKYFARAYATFDGKEYFVDLFGGAETDGTWATTLAGDESIQEQLAWSNQSYGGSTSTSVGTKNSWVAVPEPSTAMLALAGLALLIKRRRA